MSKYVYIYNKSTKEWTIVRDGISSAPFRHLRDCKISWRFMKALVKAGKNIEIVKGDLR